MSVRCIGEGHRSSLSFRTGTVSSDGRVTMDPPGPHPAAASAGPGTHHREAFRQIGRRTADRDNAWYVLDALPD